MISDRQIDEIVSVISEYVKLERKGNSYKGLCPFHKEKTPSFSVLEDRQIFKCFGCGKGGNVVHFIMQAEGLSYPDALKYLAEKQGIQIQDTEDKRAAELADKRKLIMQINKEAARFFFMQLTKSREGYEYFTGRGIPPETVKRFGLGFAPDSWDSLIRHMAGKNITAQQLDAAGLVIRNKNGGYCDKFRHKVMFPIFDVLGNVVAFGGRVLDDSKPKYINSPETALYTKGKHLYGLNFARQSGSSIGHGTYNRAGKIAEKIL
jgi:DNA primase